MNDFYKIRKRVIELGLQEEVIFTGYVSRDELALVYEGASLYVFPSIDEGFGIPILEAMESGIPVLVSNKGALMEIGGDAVESFVSNDAKDLAAKINGILKSTERQKELIKKAEIRIETFSRENFYKGFAKIISA